MKYKALVSSDWNECPQTQRGTYVSVDSHGTPGNNDSMGWVRLNTLSAKGR